MFDDENLLNPVFAAHPCLKQPPFETMIVQGYSNCVLENIRPPDGPWLKRSYLSPGGWYNGHWIWDSMFVAELLSYLPQYRENIRDAFRLYWDFQDFWNQTSPDYAHGMVANSLRTESFSPFSQSPLIAWGMQRVLSRLNDPVIIAEGLDRLEEFHDWFWRERDLDGNGLITVGTYAAIGMGRSADMSKEELLQTARFETFDFQPPLDELILVKHPRHGGDGWYGNIVLPDATAFLIQSERALAGMADLAQRPDMAKRRREKIDLAVNAMREMMWDEKSRMFMALRRDKNYEKVPVKAISGFIALAAGVPTPDQAAKMADELASPDWFTKLPIPTVARSSAYFDDEWGRSISKNGIMWRGDVWNQLNYLIGLGLATYGFRDLACRIGNATIQNVLKNGFSECYHPDTGAPLRVKNLGMSSAAISMLFAGLFDIEKFVDGVQIASFEK